MNVDKTIFKAYDIRGIFPEQIDEDMAYALGRAVATLLSKENPGKQLTLAVGGDMRTSTESLKAKLIAGLIDSGISVCDIGLVSTPTYYYTVASGGYDGGVQVSASHNPGKYNGFKIVRSGAVPMSGSTGIEDLYEIIQREDFIGLASQKGTVKIIKDSTLAAAAKYVDLAGLTKPKPIKVVVDTGSGMGALDLEALFSFFPEIELIKMNFELDGTFPVHEADPFKPENTVELQKRIVEEQADFGIATDGDADRIFFIDEKGQRVSSEIIYALIVKQSIKKYPDSIYTKEIRFGRTIDDIFAGTKTKLIPTPVGHSLIKKIMDDNNALLGGEMSGHFYIRFDFGVFESPVYITLKFLEIFFASDKTVSELVAPYLKYSNSGEINTHISTREKINEIIARLKLSYNDGPQIEIDGLRVDYPDWWFIVRASNTEPVIRLIVEANSEQLMKQKSEELLAFIKT